MGYILHGRIEVVEVPAYYQSLADTKGSKGRSTVLTLPSEAEGQGTESRSPSVDRWTIGWVYW
jgi:hypothetical protein